jgi:hypothetical protein
MTAHFNRSAPRPEICGPRSGEIGRDRYTRVARNRTRGVGWQWQGLETADWENYYSLAGSSRRLYPLRHRSDGGFEPRVMLIAPLPPAGNMYSRSARNVRTKTTRKRHTSAPSPPPAPPSLPPDPAKVGLPGERCPDENRAARVTGPPVPFAW